jgi:hypothetical protein
MLDDFLRAKDKEDPHRIFRNQFEELTRQPVLIPQPAQ